MGTKFHEKFVSTVEDRLDERELPVAMVALAGTAVSGGSFSKSERLTYFAFRCAVLLCNTRPKNTTAISTVSCIAGFTKHWWVS